MSNYRVRQVLALGSMPDRQLRLLVALATWMSDHTRIVSVGFDTLIQDTGNSHNTVRKARRELEAESRLASQRGDGRGHVTLWSVLCLPEKGTSEVDPLIGEPKGTSDIGTLPPVDKPGKGTNQGPERVPTEGAKGYQPESADQHEPERGLNRLAKSSGFLSRPEHVSDGDPDGEDERETDVDDDEEDEGPDPDAVLLAAAVPGADRADIDWAVTGLQQDQFNGRIRSVRAYLRKLIDNGDAKALVDAAAAERRRAKAELARFDHPFGSPVPARVVPGEVIPPGTEPPGDLAVLREADPSATAEEASAVMGILRQRPNVRNPAAVLRAEVRDGNGFKLLGEARQLLAREQDAATWEPERPAVTSGDDEDTPDSDPVALDIGLAAFQARAAEIRNGDSGQSADAASWLTVGCPHCQAAPGAQCTNPGTGKPTRPHSARTAIAEPAEAGTVTR